MNQATPVGHTDLAAFFGNDERDRICFFRDPDRRAMCEKRALKMARALMVGRASLSTINEIRTIAETIAKEPVS